MRRRVERWWLDNVGALLRGERVALYVYDDDKLRSSGTEYGHVGTYTKDCDLDQVLEDVVEWFRLTHPRGRGTR